jgi:hypothetical protein
MKPMSIDEFKMYLQSRGIFINHITRRKVYFASEPFIWPKGIAPIELSSEEKHHFPEGFAPAFYEKFLSENNINPKHLSLKEATKLGKISTLKLFRAIYKKETGLDAGLRESKEFCETNFIFD